MQRDATMQHIDQSESKSLKLVESATYTFRNASSDQWKDGALMVETFVPWSFLADKPWLPAILFYRSVCFGAA